ncbi:ABC-F type ribosomal protection protein CplR [Clostridium gasigenes]|uniref:Macrolide transport system ATP-binding/permease protein n=1 Tax=Clostridium gasigenes TaxID=94869 RepID=A0A1H0UJG0_9CLOT|nr:ABC-F type ribosomal protection protein CplR [Clostridium gasigenes]MBB6623182.1 ABC-F family ATP-binding cassette domain-containing protein [Clostridium gasigenes]SDP66329.1 macrolide transport system ATP-binding/permease protein [Clostridium gasigenes]
MSLAMLDKIKKYYGDRLILDIEKFEIFKEDRIGLVGENGEGKTTLIKVLLGEINVEEGNVFLTDSHAYISQKEDYKGECILSKAKSLFNAPDQYKDYLSGGEKVKLKISKALSENRSIIIADEPTSNLDSSSVSILEKMLKSYNGAMLLVSHDREFLDSLCNIIVEIENGKLKFYKGNYSKYIKIKKEEIKREAVEYTDYIKEKERLNGIILEKRGLGDSIRKTPKRMGNSEARLHKMGGQKGKQKIDKNIKAVISRVEHLDVKEKPKATSEIKIRIQEGLEIISKNPIEINEFNVIIGERILIKEATFRIKRGKKIALLGENGCGKTTLLKAILKYDNEAIKINNRVVIGYFDQNQSILKDNKTILENIMEDSSYDQSFIRINLDGFGFKGDTVLKMVNSLSGGEKVKVALCKILLSDNNVLILDEPTNYLDIKSMEALEEALINMDKTVIMVSHDRKFIANVCDYIIEIENNMVKQFNGGYSEYIREKNKPKVNNKEKENKEKLMLLQNKLSEIISILSIGGNIVDKQKLEVEYEKIIKEINKLRQR